MRIVYVLTSLGIGGAERQVVALAGRMAARGHTVALIVLSPRGTEQWPTALPVVYLGMRKSPASLSAALAAARKFLAEFHPDLVHSHTFHANILARLLHLFIPAPVLSSIHSVYDGGRARMLAYRLTDPLSVLTTAVCQAAVERYVRHKAVPTAKCIRMTNAIDAGEFAPNPDRAQRLRAEMGAASEFIWLTAGRIAPAKDYPNLLRAFAQVHTASANARLWIAGQAAAADSSAMRDLTAHLGLSDTVRWLGLRRDLPALLDAADAFVLASAWEGMPLAVGEAMAMEVPLVATDVGGVRELVGECGSIVPPKNPEALAQAMLRTMKSSEQDRRALARAARQRILHDFSLDARTDEWEALYRSMTTAG
jgi:glycosyltransferase involved in cell wall biosynthesis